MRILLPMRRTVLFTAMFAFAVLAFLPLRLVLGAVDSGLSAREATGSIWAGHLKEARIGPAALGDLDARLSPVPLLLGRARIEVARASDAPDRLAGAVAIGRHRRSVESVTGTIPIDSLGSLPVASLDLTDLTVVFRDDQCDRAEGQVRANLSGDVAGLDLPAALSGSVRCDGGALLLPLASGPGTEGLAVRIFGDGRYEARLNARAGAPATLHGRF
ncbi:general secretion pathway protein N [Sphingomonas changbaiensis NBRC 104936]|uniref:Type II secretion system protein N n=1 Tax=Sphingomonas changbaiensis NBRC 104936 TaxID=1219043 RepID=A0A0E9MNG6_9SPHN|nr:type II secretion system protein N [Sphingomonas changbaiensis]GAO38675.1 general secretion pathway protein N [Sphingomonas changbaiensis NBRC 104936]